MLSTSLGQSCQFHQENANLTKPQLMQTLSLEPGDLLQVKSTDLPAGNSIKLQPQSSAFLDISDPKAVLETTFRNFSCLTLGDVFTFNYNDTIYSVAVLEVKPDGSDTHAISVQETDLVVDFAEPIGYAEELEKLKRERASDAATSNSAGGMKPRGGLMHAQGTMAQAINYSSIAPTSTQAASGQANATSSFMGGGHRLVAKKSKGTQAPTPDGESVPIPTTAIPGGRKKTRSNGPQPLRLPPGKLFFGYELKPLRNKDEKSEDDKQTSVHFKGQGETLRKKKP